LYQDPSAAKAGSSGVGGTSELVAEKRKEIQTKLSSGAEALSVLDE
jgi:hypothetical protein